MSALSSKMAVICENPLRESDRVLSSCGMPASAVSSGTVTCFSTSAIENDSTALIMAASVLSFAFAEFGFEREGIGNGNRFAGTHARDDFLLGVIFVA